MESIKKAVKKITASSYEKVRDTLDTGDLVLFSGKGNIPAAIKWLSGSKWNHVGMVLKLEEWDMLLLWESTILSGEKDIEAKKIKSGVQLTILSDRIHSYNGEVAFRRLLSNRTYEMIDNLVNFRHEVRNRSYETSAMELIKSALDFGDFKNKEDLSSLFCSELIAEAYQRMGLLDESKPSNEFIPRDFTLEKCLEFPLNDNIIMDELKIIKK
jgi:hypothetical protein